MAFRPALFRLGTAFAALAMYGCGLSPSQVYLHDAELKTKTDAVAEAFEALDGKTSFFDQADTAFSEAGAERRASRRSRLDAMHNFSLAHLIADYDGQGHTRVAASRVRDYVLFQLELPGGVGPPDNWPDIAARIQTHEDEIEQAGSDFARHYTNYRLSGGTEKGDCDETTQELPLSEPDAVLYNLFVRECRTYLRSKTELAAAKGEFFDSEYRSESDALAAQIQVVEAARKELVERIAEIRSTAAGTPVREDAATMALRALEELLKELDEFEGVPGEIAGVDLSALTEKIDTRLLALSAKAEAAGEDVKAVIEAIADPESEPESSKVRRAKVAYEFLKRTNSIIDDLDALGDGQFPSPLAMLLLLEHQQKLVSAHERQIDFLKQRQALLRTQALAEDARRRHLFEAYEWAKQFREDCDATGVAAYIERCDGATTAARFLIQLDLAHTEGTVPLKLAGEDIVNLHRAQGLAQARANYEHVLAVVSPAIQAIEAYGSGGVKAESVAELINALALIAISVGVN